MYQVLVYKLVYRLASKRRYHKAHVNIHYRTGPAPKHFELLLYNNKLLF